MPWNARGRRRQPGSKNANNPMLGPPLPIADPRDSTGPLALAAQEFHADDGRRVFELLGEKWSEVPVTEDDRGHSAALMRLSDAEKRREWDRLLSAQVNPRVWYQELYGPHLKGLKVLEVGSGIGLDALYFSRLGAEWHCVDIAQENLELIESIFLAFGLTPPGTTVVESLASLEAAPYGFDVILCSGSMHHVPFAFSREETRRLARHLKSGGRWLELTYPRERWVEDGCLPFDQWGGITDGPGTPWAEWYDFSKMRERFFPNRLSPRVHFNFSSNHLNWFDFTVHAPDVDEVGNIEPSLTEALESTQGIVFQCHNAAQAEVTQDPWGLNIVGDPRPWAYAIDIPVRSVVDASSIGASSDRLAVAVDLVVEQGAIGLASAMASGGQLGSFIDAEVRCDESPGTQTVFFDDLPVDDAALVIRTVPSLQERPRVRITEIRVGARGHHKD